MAKVLYENSWYDELSPTGVYETVYEGMVKAQASDLWPRFHAVPFKVIVYANNEGVKADFALVERDYSEWWVVEIELAHHDFKNHILPQTRKLAEAKYGVAEAEKLCEACAKLDPTKVKAMVKDCQPRVLVVVNKPQTNWIEPLAKHKAVLGVFEVFQSDRNEHLFRVNGEHPAGHEDVISVCRFDELMNRWLLVESPVGLRVPHQRKTTIVFKDHVTEWTRWDASGKVWLYTTAGPNPLPDNKDYELVRRGDGQLLFRQIA